MMSKRETDTAATELMVQEQGYWVSRDKTCRIDFEVPGTRIHGHGSPGVRFEEEDTGTGQVVVTLGGHHAGGRLPLLRMSRGVAVELIGLLGAAIWNGHVARGLQLPPIPFRDVTGEDCDCVDCNDVARMLLETEEYE